MLFRAKEPLYLFGLLICPLAAALLFGSRGGHTEPIWDVSLAYWLLPFGTTWVRLDEVLDSCHWRSPVTFLLSISRYVLQGQYLQRCPLFLAESFLMRLVFSCFACAKLLLFF